MCQNRDAVVVNLCKPRSSGRMTATVDECIAPLVQMLNDYGVHTIGACCSHGAGIEEVLYEQDGVRYTLKIKEQTMSDDILKRIRRDNEEDYARYVGGESPRDRMLEDIDFLLDCIDALNTAVVAGYQAGKEQADD